MKASASARAYWGLPSQPRVSGQARPVFLVPLGVCPYFGTECPLVAARARREEPPPCPHQYLLKELPFRASPGTSPSLACAPCVYSSCFAPFIVFRRCSFLYLPRSQTAHAALLLVVLCAHRQRTFACFKMVVRPVCTYAAVSYAPNHLMARSASVADCRGTCHICAPASFTKQHAALRFVVTRARDADLM